jgi:hypothetical protein
MMFGTAEAARTSERALFVQQFSERLAFVVQKMGTVIKAQARLDFDPENGLRQTAYEAELIALEGASDLLGETIYDFLEAGVDAAALLNHTPARLSHLLASTSAGDGTSSPHDERAPTSTTARSHA